MPGPWLVAVVVAVIVGLGLVVAAIARARAQPVLPWALYGSALPLVALPHAVLAGRRAPGRAAIAAVVVVLAAVNVVLVNFHRALFGTIWQYVMWEGGVIEALTPLNFLFGALVFVLAAGQRRQPASARAWLAAFAVADVVLAGEEVSWGRGQILLDLNDPNFVTRYNPQNALHSFLPGFVPILGFFVIVAALRVVPGLRTGLRLPIPVGFLDAVLATAPAVLLMRLDEGRYLFVDEVYEWSGSVLLLCLALHARWDWFFEAAGDSS